MELWFSAVYRVRSLLVLALQNIQRVLRLTEINGPWYQELLLLLLFPVSKVSSNPCQRFKETITARIAKDSPACITRLLLYTVLKKRQCSRLVLSDVAASLDSQHYSTMCPPPNRHCRHVMYD